MIPTKGCLASGSSSTLKPSHDASRTPHRRRCRVVDVVRTIAEEKKKERISQELEEQKICRRLRESGWALERSQQEEMGETRLIHYHRATVLCISLARLLARLSRQRKSTVAH